MRFWMDSEYNGFNGALISMALVADDGYEWYEVLKCRSPEPWVAKHVMPKLYKEPVTRRVMRESLSAFLCSYDSVHIVTDWPQDIKHFCDLLIVSPGVRIDLPPLTMEIRHDLDTTGSLTPHNALADARCLKIAGLRSSRM